MKKYLLNNKGFTLIEILVAIIIFSTAMFGGIKLINSAIESNAYSRNALNAISWAESVVEWFRYQPVYVGSHSLQRRCIAGCKVASIKRRDGVRCSVEVKEIVGVGE